MSISASLTKALADRQFALTELRAQGTDCFRLLCEDEAPGLVIDVYGSVGIVHQYKPAARLDEVGLWLGNNLQLNSVYLKNFVKDRSQELADESMYSPEPLWGEKADPEFVVTENHHKFWIRPYAGYSSGLFLDQRENRKRIQFLSQGRRVLNLFAYTCGFSVYAATGGASEVTSVDVSKKYLSWGKQNFEANGLTGHRFIAEDALEYLTRAKRRKEIYDFVIADAPSFGRSERGVFSALKDLPTLIGSCSQVLSSDGQIFVSSNHRELCSKTLKQWGAPFGKVEVLSPPFDFASTQHPLAAVLIQK